MSIVVVGSTGNIGVPLVQELISKGHTVTAVTRDAKKSANLWGNNALVKLVEVTDYKNAAQLEAALKGAERLALIKPFEEDGIIITTNYTQAAKKVGIKQIVLLSALGAGDDPNLAEMFKFQRTAEKVIEQSGLQYTHLRPSFFHSNFLGFAGSIKFGQFSDPVLNKPQACIDVRDIASAFNTILTSDITKHHGKIYELSCEQSPSGYADKAKIIQKFIPQTIHISEVSVEAYISVLASYGLSKWHLDRISELNMFTRNGMGAPPNSHHLRDLIGRPGISFEQWAKENAEAFGTTTVVVGSTGNIGAPLVNELASKQFVRAVTRDAKKNPFEGKKFY